MTPKRRRRVVVMPVWQLRALTVGLWLLLALVATLADLLTKHTT